MVVLGLSVTAAGWMDVTVASAQLVNPDALVIPRGTSQLVNFANPIERVSIGDPEVADPVIVSPREILVNARALGTTTLIVWDVTGFTRTISIEVTVDAPSLQRQLEALFPGQNLQVSASGNLVIVSGSVTDRAIGVRAIQIAAGTGATVVDNIQVPPPRQILLNVRFAEVSQRALERLGADFLAGRTSALLNPAAPNPGDVVAGSTLSEGLVELFLFEDDIQVSAVIDALQRNGTFRSLAEPNLLAIEGQEAQFLAGGEFPYPVPQQAGTEGQGTITIEFKEFGVRLRFLPTITASGSIRLDVAPEVSSLDFASGVQFSGFNVPALLTRRAETSIELRDGQTFAIAGLLDNNAQTTVDKVPFLGDIPLLGLLFRRRESQQNRTELLVIVTPRIVEPSNVAPPLPTGEPAGWGLQAPAAQ
jgi:pilus assembly protein CpaC